MNSKYERTGDSIFFNHSWYRILCKHINWVLSNTFVMPEDQIGRLTFVPWLLILSVNGIMFFSMAYILGDPWWISSASPYVYKEIEHCIALSLRGKIQSPQLSSGFTTAG